MSIEVLTSGISKPRVSIFVTGLSETDTVTASNGSKTLTGKWTQKPNPAAHGLPDGYTELEYIESTGTQYIIPNINIVNNLYIKCKYQPTDLATDNHVLSGRDSSGWLFAAWQQTTNGVGLAFGSSDSLNTFTSYSSLDTVIEQETTVVSNTAKSSLNGVEFASITGTSSNVNSYPLYLFCMNDGGTTRYFSKIKLYSCYASIDGMPTHNFIPSKRNSDSAIGLYDLVSGTFFENAGTGTFIAGPEIPQTFDGFLIKPIRDFGTWTVTATDGTDTYTQDVLVDVITEYEIEITKKLYLYRDGDECEDVTGGWSNSGYLADSSSTRSATKNNDSIYFDDYLDCAGTANSIDLSPWSKLCAEITHTSGTEVAQPWVGYSAIKNLSGSMGRVSAGCSASGTEIVSLDISSVNEARYVMCGLTDNNQTGYVHKVWLE